MPPQKREIEKMTNQEFTGLCWERLIDPWIALENERVREALRKRDDKKVVQALDEEF